MEWWQRILSWYYSFGQRQFTGHQVMNAMFAILFIIFVCLIFYYMLFSGRSISKSEYNRLTKENEKIVQQALVRAEVAEKKAAEYLEQAEYLKQINNERAKKAEGKDKITDEKIAASDKVRDEEVKEINSTYEKDVADINNMDDAKRRDDICARIERLAQTDPSFNEYRCAR
jgi:uncharacterized membrane protein